MKSVAKIFFAVSFSLLSIGLYAQIGVGNLPGDCDCDPNLFEPVCVADEDGNVFLFENACLAECLGLEVVEDGDCGFGGDPGNGGGEPFECDCDPNVFEPVCVEIEDGLIEPFPSACLAECAGLTIVEGDCDFDDPGFPGDEPGDEPGDFPGDDPFADCDCEPDFISEVCVIDEQGNIFAFPDACLAECAGFEVLPDDECSFGGGDPLPNDCGCDWNLFEPVCAEDELGNIHFYENACLAECDGLNVIENGDCFDGNFDDPINCDCDPNIFEPVCIEIEEGVIEAFPSACLAECFGFTIVDGDCEFEDPGFPGDGPGDFPGDFPGDDPLGDCDCDPNDFDPVCVELEDGIIEVFPSSCIAECFGLTIVDGDCNFEDPGFPGDGPGDFPGDFPGDDPLGDCDCDLDEYNPVCVEDEEGNVHPFPSACVAECLGLSIVDGDCEFENPGFPIDFPGDDPLADCNCDLNVFEPVCVSLEGLVGILPNACLADCLGLEIVGDGQCLEDYPIEGTLLNNPDQMVHEELNTSYDQDQLDGPVNELRIFPNPTNSLMNVSFDKPQEGRVFIQLLNIAGQRVIAEKVVDAIGWQSIQLETESIDTGVYFLSITSESGEKQVEKVFKQ